MVHPSPAGFGSARPRPRFRSSSSDAAARNWVAMGKFSVAIAHKGGRFDLAHFADDLAEGILNRLVRAQLSKGPRAKGKLHLPDSNRQRLTPDS